jgi:hypothetical protein
LKKKDWRRKDWWKEFGEGCIQRKWPVVALDLDGAAELQGAHGALGEAETRAKVQIQLSMPSLSLIPSAYMAAGG